MIWGDPVDKSKWGTPVVCLFVNPLTPSTVDMSTIGPIYLAIHLSILLGLIWYIRNSVLSQRVSSSQIPNLDSSPPVPDLKTHHIFGLMFIPTSIACSHIDILWPFSHRFFFLFSFLFLLNHMFFPWSFSPWFFVRSPSSHGVSVFSLVKWPYSPGFLPQFFLMQCPLFPSFFPGWWFGCHQFGIFPLILGISNHPNWRTLIFFRGVFQPPTSFPRFFSGLAWPRRSRQVSLARLDLSDADLPSLTAALEKLLQHWRNEAHEFTDFSLLKSYIASLYWTTFKDY